MTFSLPFKKLKFEVIIPSTSFQFQRVGIAVSNILLTKTNPQSVNPNQHSTIYSYFPSNKTQACRCIFQTPKLKEFNVHSPYFLVFPMQTYVFASILISLPFPLPEKLPSLCIPPFSILLPFHLHFPIFNPLLQTSSFFLLSNPLNISLFFLYWRKCNMKKIEMKEKLGLIIKEYGWSPVWGIIKSKGNNR